MAKEREIGHIPKKQEVLNALETFHWFFEFSADIDKSIFVKFMSLKNVLKTTK